MARTTSATVFAVIPDSIKSVRVTFLSDGAPDSRLAVDWASVDLEAVRFYSSAYVMSACANDALAIGRCALVSAALLTAYAPENGRHGSADGMTLDELEAHPYFGKTFSAKVARAYHAALRSMEEAA